MYCPKCGEKNPDEARFCGNCGAPLPGIHASADPASTPGVASGSTVHGTEVGGGTGSQPAASGGTRRPAAADTSSVVSPELKIGIAIASVIIPIVGIVMGAIYMKDENPSKKSAGKLWLYLGLGVTVFYCVLAMLGGY